MALSSLPPRQGLYDPQFEHDACGMGFVVNIKGRKSHEIVQQGLQVLVNLEHRGASGAEECTGDGAGILIQIPHTFFAAVCEGIQLPAPGQYGVGMLFMPKDDAIRQECEKRFEQIIAEEGQTLLGWRTVPTNNSSLGMASLSVEPCVRQVFIGRGADTANVPDKDNLAFERRLFVIRKRAENEIGRSDLTEGVPFYINSLSCRTLVYKGMLTPEQLEEYYPDLADERLETALALIHSRFSTNTFPSWERAHPYRYLIHNGEINTLRGNSNWMHARQALLQSTLFGEDISKIFPIVDNSGSDSQVFDNVLEFLALGGRSLPHAVMMMIPEPWANHESMSDEKKAFYEYHASLMEPWDGPASIGFTDGIRVGAVLDRNGLRPSRYYVTSDDLVVLASEVGVLSIPPEKVIAKGRLQPGRMFLVDTELGAIVKDEEIKNQIASEHPYRQWLNEHLVSLEELPAAPHVIEPDHETVQQRQLAFGYTFEDLNITLGPMAASGVQPQGSMGNDSPLAVLSSKPQLLYSYFKQLFAQVTNPPIDAIREEIITSTVTTLGAEGNLLNPQPENCHQIKIESPILSNEDLEKLRHINQPGFKAATLPILFPVDEDGPGLEKALDNLYAEATRAIEDGANILILSDRGIDRNQAAIPALLAVSGLHHYLIREGTRTKVGLVLESGEPREVHHFSLLIGYGAGAINPYLVFESLDDMIRQGMLTDITHEKAVGKYIKGAVKGVVKTMAKMGISTIQSYRGAQIFEAIGLARDFVQKYFTWTASRVEGIGLATLAEEVKLRHRRAFPARDIEVDESLDVGGQYAWRKEGEYHFFNPLTVHKLQYACRNNNYKAFKEYTAMLNEQTTRLATLRGLLEFQFPENPIPLEDVESVDDIVKRFKTGAMSYGSISQEAHESLAIAMNRLGGKSNTGEGGEDPARYTRDANGDSRNSAIKQVASGRFGVTSNYLVHARELQIKMAQGAKPGEGGELPGTKVYPWIAKVRGATPGVGLISPPPHHDIYSIEDLAELIHDLKNSNHHARISVKLVAEVGVGTIAAGVAKAKADVVLISGYEGGTGASPQSSIWHAGIPWELGLAETHQTLLLNDLRSRIVVETDGKLMTGRDVAMACLLGAEEFGFATGPLVVLGCIMMRACHLDTCPVGVATQNPELRKLFTGDPEHVVNFMRFIAEELRELMAQLGFRTVDDMVGRVDMLEPRKAIEHWQAKGLDFSNILYRPNVSEKVGTFAQMKQDHGIERSLDMTTLLDLAEPALERGERVEASLPIKNTNRVVGTILGSEVTRRNGMPGLPEDTIRLNFKGSAGQSFGAFLPRGVTLALEGDANDYVGKGLSGGKIIIFPPDGSPFVPEDNIIIGNVAFYGATSGEAYIRGMAGERFCVRNSGVHAVVESVGDHGCEYMTGGRVVVLGYTGRNFAAGMSGGIAYVLNEVGDFEGHCNPEMVDLDKLDDVEEILTIHAMIQRHAQYTKSTLAQRILDSWDAMVPKFLKVMPRDYKRMLDAITRAKGAGLDEEAAVMVAFDENKRDLARVGGT
ncbi:MAG: glutamate synthase large subunit [Abitibacteriaceae bacterium]|nr:glutamate synthase large subunit [Abditibacteriaceae bacterium]